MTERDILHDARLLISKEVKDAVLWRNDVGYADLVGVRRDEVERWAQQAPPVLRTQIRAALLRARRTSYGLCEGSSDLIGLSNGGRFTAIELKHGSGRTTKEQDMFIALVRARGGIAGAAWSPEEALGIVKLGGSR